MCLCIIKSMINFTKIRTYVWIEFIIWFFILCFLIAGVKVFQYYHNKELKTYQIFMPDVDGMIVGSPVKFMGVQVGYISQLDIVSNDVYVKFVVTDKNTHIPQGSIATVEFSGLGGSKSLEIYPPTKESAASKKLIVINNPKRLHDSALLLNQMFDKLGSIGTKLSFFMEEINLLGFNKVKICPHDIENDIKNANKVLDEAETNRLIFSKRLKEWKR